MMVSRLSILAISSPMWVGSASPTDHTAERPRATALGIGHFERLSAFGGCALEPVIGAVTSAPVERQQLAGTGADERQLLGINNSSDGFRAMSSALRLAEPDPVLTLSGGWYGPPTRFWPSLPQHRD